MKIKKDDYAQAAKQINQTLIDEYVKSNPHVRKEDVVGKTVNGDFVFDTIQNVLQSLSKVQTNKSLISKDEQLAVHSDERYQKCLKSVKSSKTIIGYLFNCNFKKFGLMEKRQVENKLNRKERECAASTADLHSIKKTFMQWLQLDRPNKSEVKTLTKQYCQAILRQMKIQYSIYRTEIGLSDTLRDYTAKLIKKYFPNVSSTVTLQSKTTIAKVYQLLKKDQKLQVDDVKKMNRDLLEETLNQFEKHLSKQRKQTESITRVISFLEMAVAKFEEEETGEKPGEKESSANSAPQSQPSGPRMAFMSKLKSSLCKKK